MPYPQDAQQFADIVTRGEAEIIVVLKRLKFTELPGGTVEVYVNLPQDYACPHFTDLYFGGSFSFFGIGREHAHDAASLDDSVKEISEHRVEAFEGDVPVVDIARCLATLRQLDRLPDGAPIRLSFVLRSPAPPPGAEPKKEPEPDVTFEQVSLQSTGE